MTEHEIECHVQRMIDRLDAAFMSGKYTQAGYNARMKEIHDWSNVEYRFRNRTK